MSHCTGLSKVFRYLPITHTPVVVLGNSMWVAGDQASANRNWGAARTRMQVLCYCAWQEPKKKICRQLLVSKQDQIPSSTQLPTPPGTSGPSTLLPSCFPQDHHPSKTEAPSRLSGHSHQLFSYPQAPGIQACPPPFTGLQDPHPTWPWDQEPPPGSWNHLPGRWPRVWPKEPRNSSI